jgi:1-acyl-sn-glycerol-3-phosphate acyltransferase
MTSKSAQNTTLGSQPNHFRNFQLIRCVIGVYTWTVVPFLTVFFATITVVAAPIAMIFDKRRNVLHEIATLWAKSIIKANPWWTFRVTGIENLPEKGTPVVYVSNHQSQADIITVFLLNRQFRWLAKDTLFKIPFLGWAMTAAGYVPVKRGDRRSHAECFKKSREHLDRGTSMLFFPEGTRSRDSTLQPFKSGAFRLACDARVGIVPLTLQGASNLLPKGSIIPAIATVTMTIHPMISCDGKNEEQLMEIAKKVINDSLQQRMV